MTMGADAAAPPMAQEELFEYHLYTLGRPTTIGDNQTKQVAMLSGAGIPVTKEYRLVNIGTAYNYAMGDMARVNATVRMAFDNKEADHLGMPLPKGTVRVYKNDSSRPGPVRRRGRHRPHAQGRDRASQPRPGLRRHGPAEADRVRADLRPRLRGRLRDRGEERQEGAGDRDGRRAVPGPMEDDRARACRTRRSRPSRPNGRCPSPPKARPP